jgi:excisionase family DNA binding protein
MEHTYLTIAEASQFIRVSTSKIYKMTMKKEIPHYKVGGKIIFNRAKLIEFVEGGYTSKNNDNLDDFDEIFPFGIAA